MDGVNIQQIFILVVCGVPESLSLIIRRCNLHRDLYYGLGIQPTASLSFSVYFCNKECFNSSRKEKTSKEILVMDSSSSSSPKASTVVELTEDYLEELLKFTLLSSISETLEISLGLSKQYCSHLLKLDHTQQDPNSDHLSDAFEGIPLYPLYKRLASALLQCLTTGEFVRESNEVMLIKEDESLKQKEDEWSKIVRDKGMELVKMLKDVDFEIDVQEPFFTQLRVGRKTIEGRCAVGDYNRIGPGSLLLFNRCLLLEVQDVRRHPSFSELLKTESLEKVLPGVNTIEEGVQIYRNFYTEEKEKSNGVLAICVSRPKPQPYISLGSIISGLNYDGIGSLLGLMHTTGTIADTLPPPRSALLSSFLTPQNPHAAP